MAESSPEPRAQIGSPDALAVYGSLRRGEPNHWVISRIVGEWKTGWVWGWAFELTWGPAQGYDGFVPDPDGARVQVDLLVSDQLAKHWQAIDDFEGLGYERKLVEVTLDDSTTIDAWVYVALSES